MEVPSLNVRLADNQCQWVIAMSRDCTKSSRKSIIVKTKPATKHPKRFFKFVLFIIFCVVVITALYIYKKPLSALSEKIDKFIITNVPKEYSKFESIDPEERDVFEGFQTSFLPPEELIINRKGSKTKREVVKEVSSDVFLWGDLDEQPPTRVKRMNHLSLNSPEYE